MKIDTQESSDVCIVRFEGHLDTNAVPEAEARLDDIVGDGSRKVLLDLTKVDFVSSAGLRVFLTTAKTLGTKGGALRMCGLNETVRDVFEMSGLTMLLSVFDDEQDALAGF